MTYNVFGGTLNLAQLQPAFGISVRSDPDHILLRSLVSEN